MRFATERPELGDYQHVTSFEAVEEAGEPAALRGVNVPRHRLCDHASRLDLKAGCRDLLQLVVCRLASGGDAKVGEGARHGRLSSEIAVRNVPYVQNRMKLFSVQVKRR